MPYDLEIVEKISKEQAIKQGLRVRISLICFDGQPKCRVFGNPDNDLLFENEVKKQIKELNQLNYYDLITLKEYDAYTTKEVKKGQQDKIDPVINKPELKPRRKRRTKKELLDARQILQYS
ncbi:MAG: hypothetical protein WAT16_08775 [Saprospiraceae bacterium]|nr:hypothetical protein [Saprospiraceae bacterium]